MATYFTRYYYEFTDIHQVYPATWRVEILDSEGNAPAEPYKITPGAQPLITERINTSDNKFQYITGKQISISYVYTGNPNEPLPDLFFDATEMRFRARVYKNGVLNGTYYIKPDFSQYPDAAAPFTVSLKAVDGLSYAEGTKFNAYEDGLIYYEKISWYEALMTRGLFQIFDVGTPFVMLNSMRPVGADPNFHLLFDTYVHTDAFFDFVEGPLSVYDVLEQFCISFKGRLFTDENKIWFQRIQDLNAASYSVDTYTDETTVSTSVIDLTRALGPDTSYDGIPVRVSGLWSNLPAYKQADFETTYKAINQVSNFDWRDFDGTEFDDWVNQTPVSVYREGAGTIADPWRAAINYDTGPLVYIRQSIGGIGATPLNPGDIVTVEFNYRFNNTEAFAIRVGLIGSGQPLVLGAGGEWVYGGGEVNLGNRIQIKRSGNKRNGSFEITSKPIPGTIKEGAITYPMGISIELFAPNEMHVPSDSAPVDSVEIYPIKLGIIELSDIGRHIRITNTANFSQVREPEDFFFIDTGEDGVSNTIFWGDSMTPVINSWTSDTPGLNPGDLERYMAISVIDQYHRSVRSWGGSIYSNSINFYNILELSHKTGLLLMMLSDTYNNRDCEHTITMAELFEGRPTAENYEYTEWDIEDEKD